MTQKRWIKPLLSAALALLTWQSAQAENFYLAAGLGRIRASGMSDATLSLHMVVGMPVDYNLSIEAEHVEASDVGSWFNGPNDRARRLFSSHTGLAGLLYFRPNPGVRLYGRLGLGTTSQVGSDASIGDRRIWEFEPGLGALVMLRPDFQLGLEASHFWRSQANVLALMGRWSF